MSRTPSQMTSSLISVAPPVRADETHEGADVRSFPARDQLTRYLRALLGVWPPRQAFDIMVWPGRDNPGWDSSSWLGLGVASPGGTVLSLSPQVASDVNALDEHRLAATMSAAAPIEAMSLTVGALNLTVSQAIFRWSDRPTTLPEVGEWVPRHDPRVPSWLQVFNGDVLVAWDENGRFAAGVGRKQHNQHGHELAVATEVAYRGRGLGRMLVAQAARRVLADGVVPLYLHEPANAGSARVAEAAGFPDCGWRVFGLLPAVYSIP